MENKNYRNIIAWISLVVIAFCSMWLWRIESAEHGWEGLIWVTYTHYAAFIAMSVCLIWANLLLQLPTWRRVTFNILSVGYIVFTYYAFANLHAMAYSRYFGMGPLVYLFVTSPIWIYPLWTAGIILLLRIVGYNVRWVYFLAANVIIGIGFWTAPYLIDLLDLHRYTDHIHIIKTGAAIPSVVLSAGLLFIYAKKRKPMPPAQPEAILDIEIE